MIVRNFEYLLALNQEKHFARAAAACRISQPTLSAGIKQLEEDMDVMIVKRGQRFEGFTPEGERVLAWAQQMLDDCVRLKQELHTLRENAMQGPFRIGSLPATMALASVMSVPFAEEAPELQISMQTADTPTLLQQLRNGALEVAIAYADDVTGEGLTTHLLYRERMFYFTPRLAAPPSRATVEEVLSQPLCLLQAALPMTLESRLQRATKVMVTDSTAVLAAHLASGRWSTVLPQSLAGYLPAANQLQAIAMSKADQQANVGFITARIEPPPPAVHAWMELAHTPKMVTEIRKILKAHEPYLHKKQQAVKD